MTKREDEEKEKDAQEPQTDETTEKPDKEPEVPKAAPKKKRYQFECQKTGQCCRTSLLPVQVTLQDLRLWTEKGAIAAIFPKLSLKSEENQPPQIILQKYDDKDRPIDGCPMLDEDNNICTIYHSMPSWCDGFPLSFDGASYRIMDKTCPGLGKGEMTKEALVKARDITRNAFEARVNTNIILPTLTAIWSGSLMRAQAEALKNLSPEDRKNLEEMFRKDQGAETPDDSQDD
ncbi:MAG: YkgJ family cysteine cluster protein [Candidatus Heimdallarchaeota archaeon]